MKSTLSLGKLTLNNNLIQGPLAGYSCAPFRQLIWRFGNPGFCCTEMISAKDLRYRKKAPQRYLYRDPSEGPLCFQIAGNEVDDIAYATTIVSKAGADIVDLNCGCPKPKIRSKGLGAKLLTQPDLVYKLISTMKNNTDASVSIKLRVSDPVGDHDDYAVVDAAEAAGVDFIIVHGRHWTESYDVNCRFDSIKRIKSYAKVPVIANGDVESASSLKAILDYTHADGAMICRASVGQPWLIGQIQAELSGLKYKTPDAVIVGETFREHLRLLALQDGEYLATLQSRKLAKYYSRKFQGALQFVVSMQEAKNIHEANKNILNFFTK